MQFIDLKHQYTLIEEKLGRRFSEIMTNARFINGPEVSELEERLAEYTGVSHCVGISSGTDALLIALMALGVGPEDEVITTPFSFIATAEVIALLGAKPVFVDIEEKTCNIDPALIEEKITAKTKAIMPVSLYGQCADYDAIAEIAAKANIPVIEDGCQSFGATYKGKKSCGLTLIGATSFFPSKPLGCYGDGGALFTNDDELALLFKQLRDHGQESRYHHPQLGLNGRLDTLQAAVLLEKLDIFDDELKARREAADRYSAALAKVAVTPFVEEHNESAWAQYTIRLSGRDYLQQELSALSIPTAVHYPVPMHMQPVFAKFGYGEGSFPEAEKAAREVVSLPMHPYLKAQEQEKVTGAICEILR